jgi:hypothetical protein
MDNTDRDKGLLELLLGPLAELHPEGGAAVKKLCEAVGNAERPWPELGRERKRELEKVPLDYATEREVADIRSAAKRPLTRDEVFEELERRGKVPQEALEACARAAFRACVGEARRLGYHPEFERPMAAVALLAEACAHVAEGSLHGLLFARAYGKVAAEEWGAS